LSGARGYSGTFIEQYLEPLLYPIGLTGQSQLFLGLAAFFVNFVIYAHLWWICRNNGKRD
jgi:hypothetical protein